MSSEARGRIAEAMQDADPWMQAEYVDLADAVISHLWQRADDWETVQRYIAGMLEGEVKCDVHPESYHGKLEDMAAEITATIMTAIIGPRPQGEEEE